MESPETITKTSFPGLTVSLAALDKNVILEWIKERMQKLNVTQCREMINRLTDLRVKPEEGKSHSVVIDSKWKPSLVIEPGSIKLALGSEGKPENEFKLLLLLVTSLESEQLKDVMNELVDYMPSAKAA